MEKCDLYSMVSSVFVRDAKDFADGFTKISLSKYVIIILLARTWEILAA
jgi:hypothetical protein